jgi:sugar lactone lactonase YvrE
VVTLAVTSFSERDRTMTRPNRLSAASALALVGAMVLPMAAAGQSDMAPTNNLPNPYRTIEGWAKMPAGRSWGSTSAVDVDRDGVSIWVAERCSTNQRGCLTNSNLDPVMKFDANGNMVTSFGKGLIVWPHGIHVDREGNVWVVDGQDNRPQTGRGGGRGGAAAGGGGRSGGGGGGAAAGGAAGGGGGAAGRGGAGGGGAAAGGAAPAAPAAPQPWPGNLYGHQVIKFSPTGQVLMRLGRAGGVPMDSMAAMGARNDFFWQPNDVHTDPSGNIYVVEGHGGGRNRLIKFNPQGQFIAEVGGSGTGPLQFNQPHSLAMDSQGRLFVADRGNNRIQILDQNLRFLEEWYQFSRLSGIYIDANDVLYGADSESGSVNPAHVAWLRGIRVGNARTGEVTAFIPDPNPNCSGTCTAEGVAADRNGVIYGAEVGPAPGRLQRYVRN